MILCIDNIIYSIRNTTIVCVYIMELWILHKIATHNITIDFIFLYYDNNKRHVFEI